MHMYWVLLMVILIMELYIPNIYHPLLVLHRIQFINQRIYNFLKKSDDYTHLTVCHSKGEYALDFDGDGKCEVHSNTQEGIWSLLRPWIRPHRGINKKYLPLYVASCEFFYNRRHLTPAEQVRSVISIGVSHLGEIVSRFSRANLLLTLCSI